MSYTDRLREMIFESPSGVKHTVQFDQLSRSGGKKAPVTEFPGQNQGAVQDLGNTTPTFPVSCYISGSDYDVAADAFWEALHETGPGMLYHPRWGNRRVLAIPESQTEEFVNGAGRAVFSVTFIQAEEGQFEYPQSISDITSEVTANVDTAAASIADAVPEELEEPGAIASLKSSVTSALSTISTAFGNISDLADDTREEITSKVNEITGDIDDLVTAPADLMESMLTLYRYPGTVDLDVREKIRAYQTIYSDLIAGFKETSADYGENLGLINAASVSSIAVALGEAAVNGEIATRTTAGGIIEDLDSFMQTLRSDLETMESSGDFYVPVDLQLATENAVTSAIAGLIKDSLSLPAERSMILDGDIDALSLTYDLFGDTENLDLILDYNNLQGSARILVPRGTEIRWYYENT